MMKLYSGPLSLFARKVEIALHEKRLGFERIEVAFDQVRGYSPRHPAVVAANPKRQVPVLEDGELTLYDSTVICEYLEDKHPSPPLLPYDPVPRARCRQLELFADEIMIQPLRPLMHRTEPRPAEDVWRAKEAAAAEAMPAMAAQWAELDSRLAGRTFFFDALTVADIACFVIVHSGLRLAGGRLSEHANLARWYRTLRERPAFAQVVREIAAADAALSSPVEGAFENGAFAP